MFMLTGCFPRTFPNTMLELARNISWKLSIRILVKNDRINHILDPLGSTWINFGQNIKVFHLFRSHMHLDEELGYRPG